MPDFLLMLVSACFSLAYMEKLGQNKDHVLDRHEEVRNCDLLVYSGSFIYIFLKQELAMLHYEEISCQLKKAPWFVSHRFK